MKALGVRKPYSIPLPTELVSLIGMKSAKTVLEVGCGYGRASFFLRKKGLGVTGVDLDREQVERALEEARLRGFDGGMDFVVNDARNLCFPACSFDAVTMLGVLTLVPRAERLGMMMEVERVLKPRGYVLIEEFGRTWRNPVYRKRYRMMVRSRLNWERSRSEMRMGESFILAITSRGGNCTIFSMVSR
jgi:ubiquinone/menaquinone biosynthesis C-methylase UbiE